MIERLIPTPVTGKRYKHKELRAMRWQVLDARSRRITAVLWATQRSTGAQVGVLHKTEDENGYAGPALRQLGQNDYDVAVFVAFIQGGRIAPES